MHNVKRQYITVVSRESKRIISHVSYIYTHIHKYVFLLKGHALHNIASWLSQEEVLRSPAYNQRGLIRGQKARGYLENWPATLYNTSHGIY